MQLVKLLSTSTLAATCHSNLRNYDFHISIVNPSMLHVFPSWSRQRINAISAININQYKSRGASWIIIVHPSNDAPGFALCAGNAMVRIIRQNANVALSSTENRWAVTHSSLQVCMPTVQNGHGSCESLRTLFFEELRSFFHDLFIFLWLNASHQMTSKHETIFADLIKFPAQELTGRSNHSRSQQ